MRVNWNLSRILLISCCMLSSILPSIGALAQDETRPRRVTKSKDPAEAQTKPTQKPPGQAPAVQTSQSEPAQLKDQDEAIRISSNLVSVPVSVTDASGQPVGNLTAQDFRLEEEGKPQEVVTLGEPGKTPLELALLIDVSGSVYERFQFQQQAASQFLREVLKPTDAVSVFSIGLKPTLQQSRVIAIESAVSGVMNIRPLRDRRPSGRLGVASPSPPETALAAPCAESTRLFGRSWVDFGLQ